jgi:hypothetical protein
MDMSDIPAFLRITPKFEKRRIAARNAMPPAMSMRFVPEPRKTINVDPAVLAEFEALQRAKSMRSINRMKAKQETPKDLTGYVWHTGLCKWVRDPLISDAKLAEIKAKNDTSLVTTDRKPVEKSKAKGAADDLGARLAEYATDDAKLKKFGLANGVWDDKYLSLPNPGLRRMNVMNRLRNKIKKDAGYKVVWP